MYLIFTVVDDTSSSGVGFLESISEGGGSSMLRGEFSVFLQHRQEFVNVTANSNVLTVYGYRVRCCDGS